MAWNMVVLLWTQWTLGVSEHSLRQMFLFKKIVSKSFRCHSVWNSLHFVKNCVCIHVFCFSVSVHFLHFTLRTVYFRLLQEKAAVTLGFCHFYIKKKIQKYSEYKYFPPKKTHYLFSSFRNIVYILLHKVVFVFLCYFCCV